MALGKQKVNLKNAFQTNNTIANSDSKKTLSPLTTLNQPVNIFGGIKPKKLEVDRNQSIVSESEEGGQSVSHQESSLLPSLNK